MGLSEGERLQKITWAVRALVNIGNKLRDHRNQDEVYLPMSTRESINHFCAITDNLWHQFLEACGTAGLTEASEGVRDGMRMFIRKANTKRVKRALRPSR